MFGDQSKVIYTFFPLVSWWNRFSRSVERGRPERRDIINRGRKRGAFLSISYITVYTDGEEKEEVEEEEWQQFVGSVRQFHQVLHSNCLWLTEKNQSAVEVYEKKNKRRTIACNDVTAHRKRLVYIEMEKLSYIRVLFLCTFSTLVLNDYI